MRRLTAVPVPAGAVREPLGSGRAWRCVCYGLGRFAACPAARLQLAFLLLLLEMLEVSGRHVCTAHVPSPRTSVRACPCPTRVCAPQVPPRHCFLFDPAFSELELAALEALGLHLLPENEVRGPHPIPT